MPTESVAARLSAASLGQMNERELRAVLTAIVAGLRAVTLKLDNDATVTDTDFTAVLDAIIKK